MDLAKRLGAGFFGIATVAGLVGLVVDGKITVIGAIACFVIYSGLVIGNSGVVVGTIVVGFSKILNFAKDILEHGKDQEIFVHVAFNAPDAITVHPYMDLTKQILRDNKFDEYTRIVAIANEHDKRMTVDLLKEFGRNPRFRLAVYEYSKAFPLNMLCVSPCHVVISMPNDPGDGTVQSDSLALYVRSKALYNAFKVIRTFLWNQAVHLSRNTAMYDKDIENTITRLGAIPLAQQFDHESKTIPAQP